MPICVPNALPAVKVLESENIFVMTEQRAHHQDIRPLSIAILNLMPKKLETETELLRLLGNTPLQVEVELIQSSVHISKNTPEEHLLKFYKTFDDIKNERYDGLIITGAPVEHLPFTQVDYWDELCRIMEWSKTHVYSTFHICWGAQAGLYYHYGIEKHPLPQKCFGVFPHKVLSPSHPLLRGFDDVFYAPHSRHTSIDIKDVDAVPSLTTLSCSDEAGLYIACDDKAKRIFVTGHSEYDIFTLRDEYLRDKGKGLPIEVPKNYFESDDPKGAVLQRWRGHAHLLFSNWLNYFVYQATPYDLSKLSE